MAALLAAASAFTAALTPGASLPTSSYRQILVDEDILVVDKDSGLLTVPGRGPEKADCLLSRINADGFPEVLHAAHRLDRDTSGIVALGRTPRAHRALSMQFQERLVSKRYEALILGWPAEDAGEVDTCIGKVRLPEARFAEMRVVPADADGARRSVTRWRVLERGQHDESDLQWSRVELLPVTGRAQCAMLAPCVTPTRAVHHERAHRSACPGLHGDHV